MQTQTTLQSLEASHRFTAAHHSTVPFRAFCMSTGRVCTPLFLFYQGIVLRSSRSIMYCQLLFLPDLNKWATPFLSRRVLQVS